MRSQASKPWAEEGGGRYACRACYVTAQQTKRDAVLARGEEAGWRRSALRGVSVICAPRREMAVGTGGARCWRTLLRYACVMRGCGHGTRSLALGIPRVFMRVFPLSDARSRFVIRCAPTVPAVRRPRSACAGCLIVCRRSPSKASSKQHVLDDLDAWSWNLTASDLRLVRLDAATQPKGEAGGRCSWG